jgi:energy-coupling factor transporter ATP-binding protein EcfA2
MANGHPLLDWVDKQVDWARDALRRHAQATNHDIGADDRTAVVARVRAAAGFPQDKPLDHAPLAVEHLTFGPVAGSKSLLCSLGPVENLGRLAADQKLTFALDGITLVYGDNGSGKSGYCRITKKVCRSLSSERLRGNVFVEGEKPPAAAVIRYLPAGIDEPIEAKWTDGEAPPEAVRSISVFDTRNAHLYIDQENRIGFLPPEISLLERHAAHRREMDAAFVVEKKALETKCKVALPVGYSVNGNVAGMLAKLVPNAALPTEEQIKTLAEFSEEEKADLDKLDKALAQDPAVLAARLDRSSAVIKGYADLAAGLEAALSGKALEDLTSKYSTAREAEQASAVAADEQFAGEQLGGVGKGPWRLMYEHAKAYVGSIGLDHLPSEEGEPCALCQQPLGAEAAKRLQSFNAFVAGEAAKAAAAATAALNAAPEEMEPLAVPAEASVTQTLAEFRTVDDARQALGHKIAAFFAAAEARRGAFVAAIGSGDFSAIPAEPDAIAETLVSEVEALDKESATLKDAAKLNTKQADDVTRLNALKDRQWLKNALPTVLARLSDLTTLNRTLECIKLVNTGQLSTQITAVRRSLVTAGLGARIKAEIEALDLGYMPFEVSDRSKDGNSLFEVKVKAVAGGPSNEEVLSEGEQRALALACFLADVGADKANHGLVFDDPVSSLDHLRIRRVAARLVAEAAKGKQVIVFTHNLLFYNEMLTLAADQSIPTARRVVTKTNAGGFGIIADEDEPWTAQKVTARIAKLRLKAKALEDMPDQNTDAYRDAAKDFYTALRETWERLVEELLLGKVVERYSSGVQTQSLRGVTVDDNDFKTVFFAMKRVSEFSGHDQAAGKQVPTPKPDEMKADLDMIDNYRQLITKRRGQLETDRKLLEQPPKPKVA